MKNFFPLKFFVIIHSILFLVPLGIILNLVSTPHFILKILLTLWIIFLFMGVWSEYYYITLAPFLFFQGIFLTLWWFIDLRLGFLGNIFSLLSLISFYTKFKQIDKIYDIYYQYHPDRHTSIDYQEIIAISKGEYHKQIQNKVVRKNQT